MTMVKTVSAGLAAAAMLVSPAMAGWEATQEPAAVGQNYPDSHYNSGGYGVRASPGPGFYYRHPAPGAMYEIPAPPYGYDGAPDNGTFWYSR